MRPVLLEMDGFASYRKAASVDFRDADFFVLVGPTGSGKSTIIDAMVFALYGTVPRWGDRAAVAPALAPTATRGWVRLIFDIGGRRYAAVRDIRRSGGKSQSVTVKEARLERFASPDAEGEQDDDIESLATGAPKVTKAVEALLGLTFEQFIQSVALPQGEFAKFLHATDGERQSILKNLLGYGIYDDIQRSANSRATDNKLRAETLQEQLAEYGDATPEQIAELEHSHAELTQFQHHVTSVAVPALKAAIAEADLARGRTEQLTEERTELLNVVRPDGIDELDGQQQAAKSAVTIAEAEQIRLEQNDDTARAALHAAPPRHELERTLAQWAEVSTLTEQQPIFAAAAATAGAELQTAGDSRDQSDAAVLATQGALTAARRDLESRQRALTEVQTGLDSVGSIVVPDDLAATAQTIREASDVLAQANADVVSAETSQRTAVEQLDTAVDFGILTTAASDTAELQSTLADDEESTTQRADASNTLTTWRANATKAVETFAAAEKALHEAEHRNRAVAIRAHLHVGDDCPVCGNHIAELPSAADDVDLHAAQAAMKAAKASADEANAECARFEKENDSALAVRNEQLRRAETIRARLATALKVLNLGNSADILDDVLDVSAGADLLSRLAVAASTAHAGVSAAQRERAALEENRRAADIALNSARDGLRTAGKAMQLAESHATSARAALRSARDGAAVLEPPTIDDTDIEAAWFSLSKWATERAGALATRVETESGGAPGAGADVTHGQKALSTTENAATLARDRFTEASVAKKGADDAVAISEKRKAELDQLLADASAADIAADQLAHVIALQAEVTAAAAALTTSRGAVAAARDAFAAASAAIQTSWHQLQRTRDPLTRFGAPEVTTTDVASGWRLIADWSAAEAASRQVQITAAESSAVEADSSAQVANDALAEAFAARSIDLPAGLSPVMLCAQAPTSIASSLATASAGLARAQERVRESEAMRESMKQAEEQSQVARELANLMRTNQFPRWLMASALDTLLEDASGILMELSGGQFALTRNDTDLLVIDHNDADMSRLVKTLSGGETFQASLALALALSEQVTSLSAAGASKLESIFLDEGFGTLDETTLDVVAGTLENLASSGSRMVGVITHVAALAERIPVRFEITRSGGGSHIERRTP
jgi:exonuclease SbcC